MKLTLDQIQFCADECARQQSGEKSVADMCRALILAKSQTLPTFDFIKVLAKSIEPSTEGWFRQIPAKKSGQVIGLPANQIPRAMGNLISAMIDNRISADDAYQEFERIHPFIDGNRRVGSILWLFLSGKLDNPETPTPLDLFGK